MPSNSASRQALNYILHFLNIAKYSEIITKFQFAVTGVVQEWNQKIIQFNNLIMCIIVQFAVSDIDECAGVNDCSQVCTNFVGGYRCTCNDDVNWRLDADRKTCLRKFDTQSIPKWIFLLVKNFAVS